jgi:AcrR family transcriptional regulator
MRLSAAARRQQILDVATELFAERGFRGTTTRELSRRAGVNEALLFRHFPNKEELYWAVMNATRRGGRGRARLEAELGLPPSTPEEERRKFAAIAEGLLRRLRDDATLSRLLLFSALENHRLSTRFFRRYVADYYEVLADYIRSRIRAGTCRRVNPLLAARAFIGMVSHHFLVQDVFGARRYRDFDFRQVAEAFTDIWLEGIHNHRRSRSQNAHKSNKHHRSK